jgi:4-amino-4-deoxychorismate lyase
MRLLNGEPQTLIDSADRGLTLGDGFFTTIQVRDGVPLLWDLHVERLQSTAQRLFFPVLDVEQLYQRLLTQLHGMAQGCCKIIITRGSGARGYGIRGCESPNELISIHDYPVQYRDWQASGLHLAVCRGRLSHSPLLAGLKSLNRLEQVLLKTELERRGELEGLVLDIEERVVETVAANVFWRQDSVVYTPDLTQSGVTGVMRAWIMGYLAQQGIRCESVQASLHTIKAADEVWISNALLEVVPVTGIEDVTYSNHALARQLQTAFLQATQA